MATQNDYMYIGVESRRLRDGDHDTYEWDDWQYSAYSYSINTITKYFPNAVQTYGYYLKNRISNNLPKELNCCHVKYMIPNENIPIDYEKRIEQFQNEMNDYSYEINNVTFDTYYCHVVLPNELRLSNE